MSSPKGTSKHPQSFMYKDGESKLAEQSEVKALLADGWFDNPTDALAPPKTAPEASPEATADVEVAAPDPEAPTDKPAGWLSRALGRGESEPAAEAGATEADVPEVDETQATPAAEDSGDDKAG